jgi:ribosomal protein S18 acetylase RimI-like enzyme
VIRRAVPGDAPAVTAIVERAYSPYIERIGMRPGPMNCDHAAEIERGETFVLMDEEELIGLVVIVVEPDHLEIENVAVDPARQGEGNGARLLEHAETIAWNLGLDEVRLYTHVLMTENIEIYTRRGYRETERREQDGYSRVFFTLERGSVDSPRS